MKKNIFIISSLVFAFSLQLAAKKDPFLKEKSPLLVKKKKEFLIKEIAPENSPKQVIKINLSQLALTNISLQYEYAFHKNFSAALGVSYLIPRNIPSQIFTPSSNATGYQIPKFGGWSITPEIRIYPGKKVKHKAPHGFYLAPYFRYSKYTASAVYIDSVSVSERHTYDVKADYSGFTAGLMIGSQWIIGKHFSIDWWILGGGVGKAKLKLDAKSTDGSLNMTAQDQANLKNDINTNLAELKNFGNGDISIQTTSNSATATVKGLPMTSIRGFGLTIGFAF
jgi:hypothetical protein